MKAILSAVAMRGLLVLQPISRADFDHGHARRPCARYSSSRRVTPGCTNSPLVQLHGLDDAGREAP